MAGISSKAAQGDSYPENKKKYNGIELENDLELQTYNAFFRELDPQTARWWQVDPKTENMEMWSPYTSNYDNPMRYSDPLGDEGEECCWEEFKAFVTLSQAAFQTATAKTVETLGNNFKKRWEAGVTPPQKLVNSEPGEVLSLAGPLAMGENLAATEVSAAKGLLKTEVEAETKALVNTEAKALTKAQQRAEKLSQVERSGKDFTKAGKQAVIDVNKTNNNGQTVCESCVIQTLPAKQSKKGVTPPSNETQVDHIDPKANGGSGTPNNGQVLCRECNLKKGAN
ncbi:hypothetical protein NBG4_1480001 [Candidatus Sulfobium mesophilum]|uniref:HNH domain-containing protein n=1 Tax=Candidatus Sulfobium mesophilum TaxID=2016548 RepID=A0A2U3QF02_9BACT|nr:hypothetical protein NBG4_1480001 [Candidatus Sulfobium mesophilum]